MRWTRDHERAMIGGMFRMHNELQQERARWGYRAREIYRTACRGCCQARCDVGVGAVVAWTVVFLPRGAARAAVGGARAFVRLLERERVAMVWVPATCFLVRFLFNVTLGALGGLGVQIVLQLLASLCL